MRRRIGVLDLLRDGPRERRLDHAGYLAWQSARLRALVRHAWARVPFYRRRFDEVGLDPAAFRGREDLDRIPVVTRPELQGQPLEQVVARGVDARRLVAEATSGSGGEPFTIHRLPRELTAQGARWLAAQRRLGLRRRDKVAVVNFHPPGSAGPPLPVRLVNALGLHRHVRLHCLDDPETIARNLLAARPQIVVGVATSLTILRHTSQVEALGQLGMRFVTAGGQVVTDAMRRDIAETFRAPVYDFYAACETGLVASECADTGHHHVCEGNVLVEVLVDGRPAEVGERGEIVVTSLNAFAVPFIRYRLGDLVTRGPAPCSCGAPFSTLQEVVGRMGDYFHFPDGRSVHPAVLGISGIADSASWIARYQLLQDRVDRVRLRVVPRTPPTATERESLDRRMRELCGAGVEFTSELLDDLGLEGSGKFKSIISNVDSYYGGVD
jgi:phenylacetate-CoA ligase